MKIQELISLSDEIEQVVDRVASEFKNEYLAAGVTIGMRRAAEIIRDKAIQISLNKTE